AEGKLACLRYRRGQRAADIAATRHGRQIVDPLDQIAVVERLEHTEADRRRAYAAARQRKPHGADRLLITPPSDVGKLRLGGFVIGTLFAGLGFFVSPPFFLRPAAAVDRFELLLEPRAKLVTPRLTGARDVWSISAPSSGSTSPVRSRSAMAR